MRSIGWAAAVTMLANSATAADAPLNKPNPYAMPPMKIEDAIKAVEAASTPDNGAPIHDTLIYHPKADELRFGRGPGPYFPARAMDQGVTGIAVIKCTVALSGKLDDCILLAEAPTSFGFGAAALRMAFRGFMTTKPRDGATDAEDGRLVVEFVNPKSK